MMRRIVRAARYTLRGKNAAAVQYDAICASDARNARFMRLGFSLEHYVRHFGVLNTSCLKKVARDLGKENQYPS